VVREPARAVRGLVKRGAGEGKREGEECEGRTMPGPRGRGAAGKAGGRGPTSSGEEGEASLWRVASGRDGPGGGGEVEVDEDGANHGGVGDVGEDAAATAAPGAREDVLAERAPEKLGPGDAPVSGGGRQGSRRREGRRWRRRKMGAGRRRWRWRDDEGAKLGVGCEHAVEASEIDARRRNEGGQQAEQLQGSHQQVGGAVGGRALELVGEAAVLAAGEAFQGEGAASAITTEPLEVLRPLAVAAPHP